MSSPRPSFAWSVLHRPEIVSAGRYPMTDKSRGQIYRSADTVALHHHDYEGGLRIGAHDYELRPGDLTITPATVESLYDLPRQRLPSLHPLPARGCGGGRRNPRPEPTAAPAAGHRVESHPPAHRLDHGPASASYSQRRPQERPRPGGGIRRVAGTPPHHRAFRPGGGPAGAKFLAGRIRRPAPWWNSSSTGSRNRFPCPIWRRKPG